MKTNFSSFDRSEHSSNQGSSIRRAAALLVISLSVLGLAACKGDNGDKKPGQALARVNGEEVTVTQLNEELRQAGNKDANPDAQRKQMLDALVDRQLLVDEAQKQKLDRDPNVMQAIERAKAQILAQAYLKSKLADAPRPDKAEVDAYFNAHPEFFAQRKLFEMREFVVATKDFSKDLNTVMDNAKSLDEVASWLDARKIDYAKSQAMRASPDLPPQILAKMQGPDKTEMFILHNDAKTLLMSVTAVKDLPVNADAATPEITQFLANKHSQETADAELKRLRSSAKIEYLNQDVAGTVEGKPVAQGTAADATPAAPAAPEAAAATQAKSDVNPQSLK